MPCLNRINCSVIHRLPQRCGITVCCRAKVQGAPLAPGCVTMFVRHGDKGKEAKLYEDAEYEDALNQLRTLDPSFTRQVFLSTDDPVTVQYFTNVTRGWMTTYVDMPRKPDRYEGDWHECFGGPVPCWQTAHAGRHGQSSLRQHDTLGTGACLSFL